MTSENNDLTVQLDTQRLDAIQKYLLALVVEIPINENLLKPTDVAALFQKDIDARSAVSAKQGELKAAIAARKAFAVQRKSADEGLKAWILNRYGAGSPEALAFGYTPRKKAVVAAETRAEAVLLNKATRAARSTIGKKKKLAIKGTLPAPHTPPAPPIPPAPPVTTPPTHG